MVQILQMRLLALGMAVVLSMPWIIGRRKRMREEQVLMVDYDGLRGELVSLKTKYEPTRKAPYFWGKT